MRRRLAVVLLVVLLGAAALAWWQQSALVGLGVRWYLARLEATEVHDGSIAQRRAAVAGFHRLLLLAPPADALVPELFRVLTLLGERTARGDMPAAWTAYVYTGYVRELLAGRPDGPPPRTPAEVTAALEREVAFYAIRHRPGVDGVRVRGLVGGDGYTADEIDQAAREGRQLSLH